MQHLQWISLLTVLTAAKKPILDVVRVVDVPLSLLGEFFQTHLSVRYIA